MPVGEHAAGLRQAAFSDRLLWPSAEQRRSLSYAAAEVVWLVGRRPGRFDPPGGPCLREGTHDGGRLPRVFTGRLALPYDVEGAVLFSVLPDALLDLVDGLGRTAGGCATPAESGRKHPIVA